MPVPASMASSALSDCIVAGPLLLWLVDLLMHAEPERGRTALHHPHTNLMYLDKHFHTSVKIFYVHDYSLFFIFFFYFFPMITSSSSFLLSNHKRKNKQTKTSSVPKGWLIPCSSFTALFSQNTEVKDIQVWWNSGICSSEELYHCLYRDTV